MMITIAELNNVPKVTRLDILLCKLFTQEPQELLGVQKFQQLYGNIFRYPLLKNNDIYVLTGPDEIAHIFKNHETYIKCFGGVELFKQAFGSGIVNMSGQQYEDRRKNILPVFKMTNLKAYFPIMEQVSQRFIKEIRSVIKQQESDKQKPVINIEKFSTKICLEIAARVFFNRSWGDELEHVGDLVEDAVRTSRERSITKIIKNGMRIKRGVMEVKAILKKQFIEQPDFDSSSGHKGLLDYLTDYQGKPEYDYTNLDEIIDEITTLLITGHETSAITIVFALALLQINKDYKNLVLEEITQLPQDNLDYHHLQQCKYTSMLVSETLRMYPPIWQVIRRSTKHDAINGFYMPAHSLIYTNLYLLHRHPEYWPNPDVFNPFRFDESNRKNIVQNSYMPFSIGPRTCIATNFAFIEIQYILTKLLQNFDFSSIPGTQIKLSPGVTLRTEEPLHLYATVKK